MSTDARPGLGRKILSLVVAAMMATMMLAMVPGCSSSGSVAATIDGIEIPEDEVTTYIQMFRAQYGLTDADQWSSYLEQSGNTAESMRQTAIEQVARQKLVEKAASDAGITVDSSQVDSAIENMKTQAGGEDAFKTALDSIGITEDMYRNYIEQSYLQQMVTSQMLSVTPTDDDIQNSIDQNIGTYNGAKRSSHILFSSDDQGTAEQVLQQLKDGADFATLAQQYSTDTGSGSNGGDVGWDKATTFVTEYQTALDGLSKGEMTQELVQSQYGYHIILCTDEFSFPEGTTPTKDDIPSDIYEDIYNDMLTSLQNQAYSDYADQLYADAGDPVVNAMPSGLPYAA